MSGPLADGMRLIPGWLQWVILIFAVSTFVSGWGTTLLVWHEAQQTERRVERLTDELSDPTAGPSVEQVKAVCDAVGCDWPELTEGDNP